MGYILCNVLLLLSGERVLNYFVTRKKAAYSEEIILNHFNLIPLDFILALTHDILQKFDIK